MIILLNIQFQKKKKRYLPLTDNHPVAGKTLLLYQNYLKKYICNSMTCFNILKTVSKN